MNGGRTIKSKSKRKNGIRSKSKRKRKSRSGPNHVPRALDDVTHAAASKVSGLT
jgi:hypothetical protein